MVANCCIALDKWGSLELDSAFITDEEDAGDDEENTVSKAARGPALT